MNKFHASQISCKEKILSEDYWDFILPPNRSQEVLGVDSGDMCMQEMDFDFYARCRGNSGTELSDVKITWRKCDDRLRRYRN